MNDIDREFANLVEPWVLYCEQDHDWVSIGWVNESGFTFSPTAKQLTCPQCGGDPITHDPYDPPDEANKEAAP